MAPKAASRDVFVDKEGNLIRGEGGSTVGYRASGVPGTLAGFDLAFNKYGSKKVKWADLVEPARVVAQNGYVLTDRLAKLFIGYKDSLSKYPESNRIFLRNGDFFREGDTLKQPDLAETLARIKTQGAKEFYTGRTAQMIADDMKANNGLITMDDLKNYVAKERTPLRGTYRGHEIITMPPPSSGGIVMLQVLNMLEGYDIRGMGHHSSAKYHVLAEAMRRSFADRAEYMADPDFADVPVTKLVDKKYAEQRRATITEGKATASRDVKWGVFAGQEGMETTHFTVVDKDARGGPRIISAVMQSVINVIDHDMNIQQAIDAPRIHQQWLPDEVMYEPYGLSPDTMTILKGYGHTFVDRPGYIASATGIMIGVDGVRLGAIDSRSDGAAIGY